MEERRERIALGRTTLRVLRYLEDNGPTTLSHGARHASFSPNGIWVMASTNYLLRSSGMVEWAGGNYGRWDVRITDYGRECLKRGSRDPRRVVRFSDSYGPKPDEGPLAALARGEAGQ
jgi:hypothetical protein